MKFQGTAQPGAVAGDCVPQLCGVAAIRQAAATSDFCSRCSPRSPAPGGGLAEGSWVLSRFLVSATSPDARAQTQTPNSVRFDLASGCQGPAAR